MVSSIINKIMTKEEIYAWIKREIPKYKEWYQPVDFGNGVIVHVTKPHKTWWGGTKWVQHPEHIGDTSRGLSKWNYIVKKHIPDLKGKTVLELGCSAGLFSLEMARMGAREVIGMDRGDSIRQKSSKVVPAQDVIAQAYFVKRAFELLDGKEYTVGYIRENIGSSIFQNWLPKMDLVVALNVIYHEESNMYRVLDRIAQITDHLILQTTTGHDGTILGEYASVEYHIKKLKESGFTSIEVDAPEGYEMPVIIAKK